MLCEQIQSIINQTQLITTYLLYDQQVSRGLEQVSNPITLMPTSNYESTYPRDFKSEANNF